MIKKTLYFGNPAYLSMRNAQLVVKIPQVEERSDLSTGEKKDFERTIPIEDIGVVVLDNKRITLTSGLIEALLDNNAALITCDSKNMPTGLMLPLIGNTLQNERFREHFALECNRERSAIFLHSEDPQALQYHSLNDPDNVEGKAAAYYWKNVFEQFPDFVRGREGNPPNNLLNYGYAILRAVIARALVGSGLLPTLGIHHHNRYNAYCLADDIMEPYRPYVDELVIDIIRSEKDISQLTTNIKARLLNIPVIDVVIDGRRSPLMIAAGQTTASLYKCFSGELRLVSYPSMSQ